MSIYEQALKVGTVLRARDTWKVTRLGPEGFLNKGDFRGTIALIEAYDGTPFLKPTEDQARYSDDNERADFFERLKHKRIFFAVGTPFIITHTTGNGVDGSVSDIPRMYYHPVGKSGDYVACTFQASLCDEKGNIQQTRGLGATEKVRIMFYEKTQDTPHGLSTQDIATNIAPRRLVRTFG
ncbi:MAG: hypothetical protein AAF549_05655 [Pseudomonadota bacterium]